MGSVAAVAAVRGLITPVPPPVNITPERPAIIMLKILKMKKIFGYTLIELLVVISIIGILMSFALVAFQGTRKSARDARRKADLEQIRAALELCYSTSGSYPGSITTGSPITCGAPPATYLQAVPADPLGADYLYTGAANSYTLCANLEGGAENSGCPGSCTGIYNYKVCNP